MKVIILGGTGFIGTRLVQLLLDQQHAVTILTRNRQKVESRWGTSVLGIDWDPLYWGTLEKAFEGQEVIVNLAGEGIADSRWSWSRKQLLHQSRIDLTRSVVNTLSHLSSPPRILINASGIGYYGIHPTEVVEESSGPGTGFLADLCVEWEREALKARDYGVRVVMLRIGMVLGKEGGALANMLPPFNMFVGGPILPGTQPISWIHIDDLCHLMMKVMEDPQSKGPVNAVSPHPVTMQQFCHTLGKVLGRPSWLPVPGLALKVALGEMSTLLTHGQMVKPTVAHQLGFEYQFPFVEQALESIVRHETR